LLEEGAKALPDAARKEAVDQLVTALKADVEITPEEQKAAALAAAGAGLMQAFGGRDTRDVGSVAQSAAHQVWKGWVDSAFTLLKAGYTDDANAFFEKCIEIFPYTDLKGRCALGLARSRPDEAYERLLALTEATDSNVVGAALRLLGEMAGQDGFPEEKKGVVIATITSFTGGLKKATHGVAACHGLIATGDARVVPTLQALSKGMMNADFQPCARRGLLLSFSDRSVVPLLEKSLKGGTFSTAEPSDKLAAASLLIEAGEASGYAWASEQLTAQPQKGGRFKKLMKTSSDDVDFKPALVRILVRVGGERSVATLREAIASAEKGSWLETWIAIGLLELDDAAHLELVRGALGRPEWEFTTVRMATALARHGDNSGIPALGRLYEKAAQGLEPETGKAVLAFLAGEGEEWGSSREEKQRRLVRLRLQIADALAVIDQADTAALLGKMLDDAEASVRVAAAYALARMSDPAAAAGLAKAVAVDYGASGESSRNPTVHAHLVRQAALRFAGEAATRSLVDTAKSSSYTSVRFLAACCAEALKA